MSFIWSVTFAKLFFFGQQENIYIVMFLQSRSECSSLLVKEEHERNRDVIRRVSIANHLKEGSLSAAGALSVICENIQNQTMNIIRRFLIGLIQEQKNKKATTKRLIQTYEIVPALPKVLKNTPKMYYTVSQCSLY